MNILKCQRNGFKEESGTFELKERDNREEMNIKGNGIWFCC
jgi:hypothetical protein